MTPVDPPYTPMVSTAIGSNWCASARAAYLPCLRSSAQFATVPAFIADLFRCTSAKVSTHAQSQTKFPPQLNGKTAISSGRESFPLSEPWRFQNRRQTSFFSALVLSYIIQCSVPWEATSTAYAGQGIQTHFVHPLTAPTRIGNTKLPTVKAMSTRKTFSYWA